MRNLRTDIQVLRAIAVLSVLIFHFDFPALHKGYLGVDIFFVISGYLMSRVIIDEMDEGRFHAASFYFRRARRLLPAAWAMFVVVTAVAPYTLTASALRDFGEQLLGALGFVANIVLWEQSGYFDGRSALKPLLHTWSLALEEQYYFVLPALLALLGQRWRTVGLTVIALASWVGCQWWLRSDPTAAFYLLPTRAWELMMGSLCALPTLAKRWPWRFDPAWVCLPMLAVSLVVGVDDVHPRWDALMVCVATAGLLLCPSPALQSMRMWMRPLHWVGDRSYSLYLVHWPLIAIAKHVWLQGVPPWVSVILLVVAFAWAHASYEWIEQPFRRMAQPSHFALTSGVLTALPLLLAGLVLVLHLRSIDSHVWAQARRGNYGFSASCDQGSDFHSSRDCSSTAQPRMAVWGDSYAMHLISALAAQPPAGGFMQITRSSCAPLLDYARQATTDPPHRGEQCLSFNRSVLAYLRAQPHVTHVVLSSRWQYFFDEPVVNAQGKPAHPTSGDLIASAARTIEALRAMGKKVVIVSPPALLGPDVDLAVCAERHMQGLLTIAPLLHQDCTFARTDHVQRQRAVLELLQSVSAQADVDVIALDDFNCHQARCKAIVNGVSLYRDFGHLSLQGAQTLGLGLHLGNHIERRAR